MGEASRETVDPRIRRTRQLLQQALAKLLTAKEFENISVQDITETATVNRATFYDHYPDKFALLECMVASRFHELLAGRGVHFGASCSSALHAIVLGVCDYVAGMPGMDCERQRKMEPHMESAVIAVVRTMILEGLKEHAAAEARPCSGGAVSLELVATTASWAIYGGAKEWLRTPNRCPSEQVAETVVRLVEPILAAA